MRPIKLVMSAFGSYAEKETIDFSFMSEGGIFLITGDTGSGKTTIFDGITYALYGETSGKNREGNMMRSDYATPETETFVELTFRYKDALYKVKRSPEYLRPSKNKSKDGERKLVSEKAKLELTLSNNEVFQGKIKETQEKIIEILGLDINQFTQITMIAQGDFLKLLHAESRDRKAIFSRIFHTDKYRKLQETLKEQTKLLNEKVENSIRDVNNNFALLELSKDSDCLTRLTEIRAMSLIPKEEGLTLINTLIDNDENEINEKQKVLGKSLEAWEILKADIVKAKDQNSNIEKYKRAEIAKSKLQKEAGRITSLREQLLKIDKALVVGISETKAGRVREQYENAKKHKETLLKELEKISTRCELLRGEYEEAKKETTKNEEPLRKKIIGLEENRPLYEEIEKFLKEIAPEINTNRSGEIYEYTDKTKIRDILNDSKTVYLESTTKINVIKEISEEINSLTINKKQLKQYYEEVVKKQKAYKEAHEIHEQARRSYLDSIAGILAKDLEEEAPCPVCGSKEHPHKAQLAKESYTKDELEVLADKAELTLKSRNEADNRYREQTVKVEEQQNNIQKEMKRLTNASKAAGIEALNTLESKYEYIRISIYQKLKSLDIEELVKEELLLKKKLKNLQDNLAKKQSDYQSSKELVKSKEGEIKRNNEEILTSTKELEAADSELEKALIKNDFYNIEAYKEVKRTQPESGFMKEEIKQYEQSLTSADTILATLSDQVKGKEVMDITKLQESEELRKSEVDILRKEAALTEQRLDNNRKVLVRVETIYEKQAKEQNEFLLMQTLSKTANGGLSGNRKLDYETYVQRSYFKRIIAAANKRLAKMTDEDFLLKARDLEHISARGLSGLELDVYSTVNNSVRDVKTLSGGESFMAALSMALGLSDVIQNMSGGIRLDTMFVDEGFGALDDATRDQAMKVLQNLAGDSRLLGVISHVNELKDRIDTKLVVTKTDKGSSTRWMK